MKRSPYTRKALIAGLVLFTFILFTLVLQQVASVLLVVFAGGLLAVFLDGLSTKVGQHTPLSRGWALALVITLLVAFFVGAGWYAGPRINDQITQLGDRIPNAIDRIQSILQQYGWGESVLASSPSMQQVMSFVAGGLTNAIGTITSSVVVIIIGIYGAAAPMTYINGAVRLIPPSKRDRGRSVIRALGHALRWWLVGRIASMTVVGVLTAAGLWIAGVQLAFVLGLIAALLSFVPYIGPIVSVVPAALVALAESPTKVLYVLVVYGVVQFLESNLITPLIQERVVSIPPAVLISTQVLMGVLAGALGILLATPLAVAFIVLVQMLYLEDMLGDSVKTLGE
jgi:predicted PurR-regulated permease PerM